MADDEATTLLFSGAESFRRTQRRLVIVCILLTELCERLTYYSISANLVLYCTNQLDFSDIDGTTVYFVFTGFCYIIPIFGGWIADSVAGRYNSIYGSGLIYIIGTVLLPLASVDYLETYGTNDDGEKMELDKESQTAYYMIGLAFIAIGTGGIKANVGPFGAYQLEDLGEKYVQKFFNWFYWFINLGSAIAFSFIAYLQQNVNFFVGYLVPALSMILSILIFMVARNKYREMPPGGSVITRVFKIIAEGRKKKKEGLYNLPSFLDHAKDTHGGNYPDQEVEGVKSLGKIIPIFVTFILYWTLYAQMQSSYLLQGVRMNLGFGSWIPAASLNLFNTVIILVLVPLMDLVIYPALSNYGVRFTQLQRIGTGMILASLSVIVAGVVEIYRKQDKFSDQIIADKHYNSSEMSIFVQIPQFCLIGASEVFTSISGLEYAYSQAPEALQGLVMGLFLMTTGLGNWVGTALINIVQAITGDSDKPWIPDEINDGYLENFFFLLAILMVLNFVAYLGVVYWLKRPIRLEVAPGVENPNYYSTSIKEPLESVSNHHYDCADPKDDSKYETVHFTKSQGSEDYTQIQKNKESTNL